MMRKHVTVLKLTEKMGSRGEERSICRELPNSDRGDTKTPGAEVLNRRDMLASGTLAIAATLTGRTAFAASPASERPKEGDRLVLDGKSDPVRLDMVQKGGPIMKALPADAATGTVRNGSRFNKLVLIRLAPEELDEDTRQHAAEGILAFSAICTHKGCAITGWNEPKKALACFCHGSFFSAGQGGKVVGGPATRRLPILPLAIGPEQALLVAGEFTGKPGVKV